MASGSPDVVTIIVKDATVEALTIKGGTVVDQSLYSAGGEENWSPFVTSALKDLKMNYPRPSKKHQEELKAIRKLLER